MAAIVTASARDDGRRRAREVRRFLGFPLRRRDVLRVSSRVSIDPPAPPRSRPVWGLPFAILLVAIVTVPAKILDYRGLPRLRALETQLDRVRAENERIEREVHALHRQVDALRSDPHALERVARDELGMLREGELVFQFPD
jgi:cell division protein FtsB